MSIKPWERSKKNDQPATKTPPIIEKLPDGVVALIDAGSFKIQTVLMMQIGTIVADSLQSKQTVAVNHKACHALMAMKMTSSLKTNFIKYTTAFAEYATLKDVRDAPGLIKHWWSVASADRNPPPYEWFDHTRKMGPQLTTIAMCAVTMIQVLDGQGEFETPTPSSDDVYDALKHSFGL